jgi:hypothetical protein
MEILSNKLKMRDKNTQFVNNTLQIINHNAIPSNNIATLVLNRENINVDEDDGNSGDINNNNNNNNNYYYYYYYYHHHQLFLPNNSLKISNKTYGDLNIKLLNCLVPYILISSILSA